MTTLRDDTAGPAVATPRPLPPGTPPLASPDDGPAAPGPARWVNPWPALLAVLAVTALAMTSTTPRATQALVLVVVGTGAATGMLGRGTRIRGVGVVTAMLTLFIAVPVARVPNNKVLLALVLAGAVALCVIGFVAVGRRTLPRGTGLVLALFALLAATTATLQVNGMVPLLLVAVAGPPLLVLVGALGAGGRRDVAAVVVSLAAAQGLLTVAEVWVLPDPLWAPAQLGSAGQVVPLTNEILGSVERSQGTLGHPLPLGLLLLVGVALSSRVVPAAHPVLRAAVPAVLLIGLVLAGARTSVAMALVVLLLLSGRRLTPARLVTAMALLTVSAAALLSTVDVGGWWAEVSASGSWSHRVGALQSVGRLLLWQDMDSVVLGKGYGSTAGAISAGLLQNDGFAAVDNQFILMLSQGGLLGLGLLVILLGTALVRGRAAVRPAVLCVLATMMVFDVLLWPSAAAVAFAVLGLALTRHDAPDPDRAGGPDDAPTGPATAELVQGPGQG